MVLIKKVIQDYVNQYLQLYLAFAKENGYHFIVLLDIMFYWRFQHHIVKHFSTAINTITWNKFKNDSEIDWLMFWIPLLRDTTNKAKLTDKMEKILNDTKTPKCVYEAVEYIVSNIEEYNIHEVFKKWS